MVQFDLLLAPLSRQPLGQVRPFGLGVGNCLMRSCPGGGGLGGGANKK